MDEVAKEQFRNSAALFIHAMKQGSGVELRYDQESIDWVDNYIVRMREVFQSNPAMRDAMVEGIGSFLGECMISTYGGRWVLAEERNEWGVRVGRTDAASIVAFPATKVHKQITTPDGESISSLFSTIPILLARYE